MYVARLDHGQTVCGAGQSQALGQGGHEGLVSAGSCRQDDGGGDGPWSLNHHDGRGRGLLEYRHGYKIMVVSLGLVLKKTS